MPDINEPTEAALELGEKLKVPNVEFDAWVASMPAKHWSKYDLSACRLGWEAGRRVASAPSFADVRVKPLEWENQVGRQGLFVYTVKEPNMTPGWRVWVHEKGHASVGGTIVTMAAPDFNAAKAAAQSNYERRIRSALDIVSASSFADGIDAERQKREAAEREIVSLRSEIDCYETEKEDLESEFTKAEEYHASSLAKANARIAEQDRAIARLQANNSSMAWTKMLARITELEKALIVERQRWWQPEYPDQAKPVLAVWFDHESEHGLSGFDNAADLDAFQAGAHGPFLRRVTGNEYR